MSQILFQVYPITVILIGLIGIIINKKNLILTIIAFELLLLGINLNFLSNCIFLDNLEGEIMSIFILVIAASETSIGLAFLISYYRIKGSISLTYLNTLKG